jgi:probable HAF family extracellular repeat protein
VNKHLAIALLAAFTCLAVAPTISHAQSCTQAPCFQGLGFLPGTNASAALALSADGTVAVGYGSDTNGHQQAFRWVNGVMTNLGTLPGDTDSVATAVNADGTVVVGISSHTNADQTVSTQAFRWANGIMTGLGFMPNGTLSSARGVNADGTVVVGQANSINHPNGEAVRWVNGTISGLGSLCDACTSQAWGVNADGTVVVGQSQDSTNKLQAFRWTASDGTMAGLGGTQAVAYAVNADGTVVVGANSYQGFRWTPSAGMVSLGPSSIFFGSLQARAVNADGSVLVGQEVIFCSYPNCPIIAAFRWARGAGRRDIETLLTAAGVDLSGWQAPRDAYGISADGTAIVGSGGASLDRAPAGAASTGAHPRLQWRRLQRHPPSKHRRRNCHVVHEWQRDDSGRCRDRLCGSQRLDHHRTARH